MGNEQNLKISVVIPSSDGYRDGKVPALIEMLERQTYQNKEVLLIKGVSPQGRAINMGASKAGGDILVIMDDDSLPADVSVLGNLIKPFLIDKKVGMSGASITVNPDASIFQKVVAREFPRFSVPVVKEVTESDLACHGCCAIPLGVFKDIGGENENLVRGLDPDLRQRLRAKGYKVVLAPDCLVYHPPPSSFSRFLKIMYRNGFGSAYAQKVHPELVYLTDERLKSGRRLYRSFAARIAVYPLRMIDYIRGMKFFRLIGSTVYLFGFFSGYISYRKRYEDKG
jgi:GT2 family glycosyltransferase